MEIRPRSFGDSLADLINMLAKVWRPLLMPALIASAVVTIVTYAVLNDPAILDFLGLAFNDPEALGALSDEQLREIFADLTRAFTVVGLVSLATYGLLFIASARAVAEQLAAEPSGDSVARVTINNTLSWIIALGLIIAGTAAGFVLLVVPGVWLAVAMAMVAPVLAVERKGPIAAMKRSFELVRGNWWETCGFLVLVGLIGLTATQLIQLISVPMLMVGNPSFAFGITIALGVAFQGLIIAAIGVGTAIWYFNLSARLDGVYQLELI